jgi:hypothetical protein
MKKENIRLFSSLVMIVIAAFSCKKNNSFSVTPANIYVAGSTAYSATLWNNNQISNLTADSVSSANSVYVNGSDVYVGGAIFVNGFGNIPVYWKNGIANFLSLPDSTNTVGEVNSIVVSGSDVYVGGTAGNQISDSTTYAVLWKDGNINILDSIPFFDSTLNLPCTVNSIAVSGNNVYAAGYGQSGACYWNNGNVTSLASDANTIANGLSVSGSDVYVAGQQTDSAFSVATYWKNGTPQSLKITLNGNSICRSVFVSGADVYVCGNQTINGTIVASYWKNGIPVVIGSSVSSSDAYSIFVKGSDIYVAGKANDAACYWKNGTEILLSQTAVANSLFVE